MIDPKDDIQLSELTHEIIGAAMEVHKIVGPGLLESTYERCLAYELEQRRLDVERQVPLPMTYKDLKLDCSYRLDMVVAGKVILELKSVDQLAPIHEAQLLTYLRLAGLPVGLLINFNVPLLKEGIKRMANTRSSSAPSASPR